MRYWFRDKSELRTIIKLREREIKELRAQVNKERATYLEAVKKHEKDIAYYRDGMAMQEAYAEMWAVNDMVRAEAKVADLEARVEQLTVDKASLMAAVELYNLDTGA